MRKIYFTLLTLLCSISINAQLAMNEWNVHLAYNNTSIVAQSPTHIYALSGDAMFSVDKETELIEYYSKLNGLTGTTIANIAFEIKSQTLVVVYKNGHIDLIKDGVTNSVIDLYNKQLNVPSKAPNDISCINGKAYMAMQFGILVLNVERQEIADTYYIGNNSSEVNLTSISVSNDTISAVTDTELYQAPLNSPNLLDYSNWTHTTIDTSEIGLFRQIIYFGDTLVAHTTKGLLYRSNGQWKHINNQLDSKYIYHLRYDNDLLVCAADGLFIVHPDFTYEQENMIMPVLDVARQNKDEFWVAADNKGIGYMNHYRHQYNTYKPNGPAVNMPYWMGFAGEKLFVVPGGRWAVQYMRLGHVMMYENGEWTNIENSYIRKAANYYSTDFMNVACFPNDNNHFFVTSYGNGLFEFEGTSLVKHYNTDNSVLTSAAPDAPTLYTRTAGAIFDNKGNLILINVGNSEHTIIIRTAAGEWIAQDLYLNGKRFAIESAGDMIIDRRNPNIKWINYCREEPGLIMWDDNGTLTDTSDDIIAHHSTLIDQNGNSLNPNSIYSFAQDHDGAIWLGTELGPIIIPASSNYKVSNSCRRILLNRDDGTGLADYLLDGVQINAIAIDGGNRKWLGTANNGLYLLSEDGTQTIEHFTTSNSPLLSDVILSLAINNRSGEVFIGTEAGLISYQSDAADPNSSFDDVYAYPNPVREDHDGVITIAGLMENSTVKIVDTAGRLMYETTSQGSLATWDGNNAHGQRVPTGVYIVMVNSEDGSMHQTTKILIINK